MLIRFAVCGALVAGPFVGRYAVGIDGLSIAPFASLATLLFVFNVITFLLIRPYRHQPERARGARRFLIVLLHFSITTDYLCLTLALWNVGGPRSPFQAFFIFHVIVASILLSPRSAMAYAALGLRRSSPAW